jgi:hypothetical protein
MFITESFVAHSNSGFPALAQDPEAPLLSASWPRLYPVIPLRRWPPKTSASLPQIPLNIRKAFPQSPTVHPAAVALAMHSAVHRTKGSVCARSMLHRKSAPPAPHQRSMASVSVKATGMIQELHTFAGNCSMCASAVGPCAQTSGRQGAKLFPDWRPLGVSQMVKSVSDAQGVCISATFWDKKCVLVSNGCTTSNS